MGSLLGSKGQKQSSTATQQSQSRQQSTSFDRTTPGFLENLNREYDTIVSGQGSYSKGAALNDVTGVLQNQAMRALESVMPSIARQEIGAGAYNSSTKQLLQDNAQAQIISQLANTQLDAVKSYAGIENQFLGNLASIVQATTSRESGSQSSGDSTSYGSTVSRGSGGGSGLLGLFADGGTVPKVELVNATPTAAQQMKARNVAAQDPLKVFGDLIDLAKGTGSLSQIAKSTDIGQEYDQIMGLVEKIGSLFSSPYENVGEVADLDTLLFANGGQVPEKAQLLEAIQKYAAGGKVRSGEKDIQAGGKIGGKQSTTGEDNQVIGVAGGEGIIAADVMKVPGVSEFVKLLNDKFHTPIQ